MLKLFFCTFDPGKTLAATVPWGLGPSGSGWRIHRGLGGCSVSSTGSQTRFYPRTIQLTVINTLHRQLQSRPRRIQRCRQKFARRQENRLQHIILCTARTVFRFTHLITTIAPDAPPVAVARQPHPIPQGSCRSGRCNQLRRRSWFSPIHRGLGPLSSPMQAPSQGLLAAESAHLIN